ncbi:MAG TPA: hypothetical protein VM327_03530 [Candidatus Thermoplasmatota archaeon]|nr:hypothetical protein [Candidatus Thermoplasmatota archaeon]
MRPRSVAALLLLLATAMVPAAQAAARSMEPPGDFHNGQENDFGSIAMEPYLSTSDAALPIEASIVLRDLEALRSAADVLFAFNVKGDAVRAEIEALQTKDGKALTPVATGTVDHGRQPQVHFLPQDLLALAEDGRIDLVLKGHVGPVADSQSHVGGLVIAFDDGWGTVRSGDGPAQLYGFTLVSVDGAGGGAMPFQGQGNTWMVLPLAMVAVLVALAGATAVSTLVRLPGTAVLLAPPGQVSPQVSPPLPSGPPQQDGPAPASMPIFGGRASPAVVQRPATRAVAQPIYVPAPPAPLQGPLLPLASAPAERPPGPPRRASATPRAPPLAEATASVPARPARPSASISSRGKAAAKPARDGVPTSAKRPKAKPVPVARPDPEARPRRRSVSQASR